MLTDIRVLADHFLIALPNINTIHWLAGANQPAQPAKPAWPPSRPHLPPPLAQRNGRSRALDRVRAAMPRGRHARPNRLQHTRHSLLSPVRSVSLSLSLLLPCLHSACARTAIAIGASELLPGCSSPTSALFFDFFFPELRFHTTVADAPPSALKRSVRPCSPSPSSPALTPPLRMWAARYRASLRLLPSASCSP